MRLTQANLRRIIREELEARRLGEGNVHEDEVELLIRTMQRKLEAFRLEVEEIVNELERFGLDSLPLQEKMDELREEFEGCYEKLSPMTGD